MNLFYVYIFVFVVIAFSKVYCEMNYENYDSDEEELDEDAT